MRIVAIAAIILAVFTATNLVYHVLRKPPEMFVLVSGGLNEARQYGPSFASIPRPPSHPSCLRRRGRDIRMTNRGLWVRGEGLCASIVSSALRPAG
jgi:hypothetical protein